MIGRKLENAPRSPDNVMEQHQLLLKSRQPNQSDPHQLIDGGPCR
jgi:hypothetical protein